MSIPTPVFVNYGLSGGVCCSCIFTVNESDYLVAGTVHGVCKVFSTKSHLPILNAYDDPEHRSVISVGQIRSGYLFLHVRSYGVLLVKFNKGSEELEYSIEKLLVTKHYGFCRTISHLGYVYIPLYDELKNSVKIVDEHLNERDVEINFEDGKSRGMLMSFNAFHERESVEQLLICCFEEGSVAVMDVRNATVTYLVRPFEETVFACAVFNDLVAVGSVKNVIKLYRIRGSTLNYEKSIAFPSQVGGCGSLCFSPCGKYLASGYWNGSIRVHSVKSSRILVVIDFHKDTVDFLDWHPVNRKRLLFSCCKDGALSIWNLLKD